MEFSDADAEEGAGVSAQAEDFYCEFMNLRVQEADKLASSGIATQAERIETASGIGALISKLQRVQTELTFESPFHGAYGDLGEAGDYFGIAKSK